MASSRGSSRTSGFPIQTSPQFGLRNHALRGEHTIVTIVTKGTSMAGGVTYLRDGLGRFQRLLQVAPPVRSNWLARPRLTARNPAKKKGANRHEPPAGRPQCEMSPQ